MAQEDFHSPSAVGALVANQAGVPSPPFKKSRMLKPASFAMGFSEQFRLKLKNQLIGGKESNQKT
jgi:hypothetical protein